MAAPATVVMNTITDTQEKVLDAIQSAQAPVVDYVRKAVDYLESSVPELPTRTLGEKVPTIKQVVDSQFTFAGRFLDSQHKFVDDLLDVTKPVTEKVVVQKPATGVRKPASKAARKAA
jgi:hypothetical protein